MGRKQKRAKKGTGRYLSPGVYVEEVSSGARPIEGVGTAVAAFVGMARRHPVRTAVAALVVLSVLGAVVRARRG